MRKVTQRITALALASAVAFSVLPTAAFAEASLDAASTAVQAEAEPESQPVPEQASSDAFVEAASSEAASSEAASSEAASSEAASSEAASSEAASSEAASSEAASSEAASSEAASSEAASSEAASSEAASSEAADEQPVETTSLLNTLANNDEYTMNLDEDGQTTQRAIYEALGGETVTAFGITSPKESFKIDGTTIGLKNITNFDESITLTAGPHTVQKCVWVRHGFISTPEWCDYGTLIVNVKVRKVVKMAIDNDYTVKYKAGKAGHDEMDAFVAQQRTQHVQMLDENGKAFPDAGFTDDDFTFEYKHAAGEQELTVTFKGNKEYKPATATGKILVTKGDAAVTVHSQTIQYGDSFVAPIFTADPTEAGVVGLIGGVKADGGLFVGIDGNITLNQLLGTDIPVIGNTSLKTFLAGQDEIKLGELTKVLEKLLKVSDYLPSGDLKTALETIQKAIDALTAAVPGISNAVISLNYPTEAGIYTAVGFTTSQNYETAIGTGMLVIKQQCATVTVHSQVINFGDPLEPVFSCTPIEANGVGIIAGLNTSGGYYVGVKFCNPKMQEHVNGKTTLKELASVLEKVPEADTTGLNSAVSVLNKIMPGIENTVITFDDPVDAGIYTAVGFTTNKNYQVAPVFGSIVIGQDCVSKKLVFNQELPASKTLAVSEAKDFTFGGHLEDVSRALPTIGVNASYVGVKSNGRPYAGSTPCYEPGCYTETVYLVGTNFTACPISRCYTIINDQIMVYPVDAQKVYGDPDPDFKIEVITNNGTPETVLAKDYPGVSVVRTPGENVGSYDLSIQLDQSLLNTEYTTYRTPKDKKAQLVINQREVTMQFENAFIVYGKAAPAAQYQFLRDGKADTVLTAENFATELPGAKIVLLNSENQIVTDTTKLDAGIYTYTVLYTPEGCNFKLTVEDGTLIVAPRDIIVQFKDASIVYGDATPAAEYQFLNESTGEVDTVLTPDNFAAEVPGAQIVLMNSKNEIVTDTTKLDAGEYHYTVSNLPEASNYLFTIQGGKLTVAPRSIYLQVKDASMTEGESFPAVEFSFFEAGENGKKLDAVADWMSDELAETKIAVAYADATQGPKLSAGQYDMSFDQIAFADAAAASNAKVAMSVTGLYDNTNYDVNLFTLNEEHTKLATLTVNKKPSSGGNHSSSSSNKGSDSDNNNAAEEQSAVQQIAAVQPASVQTGDNSSLLLNLAVLLASVLGLVVILRKKI